MVLRDSTAEASWAAIRACIRLGMAIAAMMRIIATTISNSIRENPFCVFFLRVIGRVLVSRTRMRWETCRETSSLPLHHVNLSAVFVKFHLIHQLVDQENSPAVVGVKVLTNSTTRDGARVKAFARISHDNKDSALLIAGDKALDNLAGILLGTVHHGVS